MKILVTNDDGVFSPGLWALVEGLGGLGEVVVVAPDREQSGVGASITLHSPVRASEVPPRVEGIATWAVEGTPADSVILGLEELAGPGVDLLICGINQGANLGQDVLVSGTVGAALQGYCRGIPSLAISVTSLQDLVYQPAVLLARLLAQHMGGKALSQPLLLNVNLPNVPLGKLEGIEVTRAGRRAYMDIVTTGDDGKRRWYWIRRQDPGWELLEGTDIYAVRHNRVSITPIHADLTAPDQFAGMYKLCRELGLALKGRQGSRSRGAT